MSRNHHWAAPVLFAIYPILFLFSRNMDEVSPTEVLPLLAGIPFLMAVVWIVLSRMTRTGEEASLFLSAFSILFFSYGALHASLRDWTPFGFEIGRERYLILLDLSLLAFVIGFVRWKPRSVAPLLAFLERVSLLLILLTLVSIVWEWGTGTETIEQDEDSIRLENREVLPDIYYLVLDAYARADVLKELYGYDNTPFLDRLREMGFYVAGESRANYPMTALSTACTLNLEYLDELTKDAPPALLESYNFRPLIARIRDNRVFRSLKPLGYRTVAFAPGVSVVDLKNADLYLSPRLRLTAFQNALLNMTPIPIFLKKLHFKSQYDLHRERILFTLDRLPTLASREDFETPVFVFCHLICPHPPFVFDARGEPIGEPGGMAFMEPDNIWKRREQGEEYRKRYTAQLRFLSNRILEIVEQILERSPSDPVILIQSDHGPGLELNWENPNEKTLRERLSILYAYHLPGATSEQVLYPSITPVNSFRALFREVFGADLELLPDRSFFSTPKKPYRWREVFVDKESPTSADNQKR